MALYIVGVDDSSTALEAAQRAAALARATSARLHVITAAPRESAAYEDTRTQVSVDLSDQAAETVEAVAEQLRATTDDVTTGVVIGRPAEALVGEAERLGAELIVVGNRRTQSPVARVLGSIATAVAHNAPCDVYIVNTHREND